MNCELAEAALLDEALPRPDGLEAHLASCPHCQAVGRAHRSALRLRGQSLSRTHRRPLAEVRRRAGVVFGLLLAVGGGVGWYELERAEVPAVAVAPTPVAPLEQPAMQVVAEEAAPHPELLALAALAAQVATDTAREPRDDALLKKVFGALPRWTAPRRTHPLRSLGGAASPVVYTSEDSP